MVRFFRKYHKWLGVIFALIILSYVFSGIILNHREALSFVDVNRKLLPKEYRYRNWNNAAVKSTLKISSDSILIYGNIGIWLTDSSFSDFTNMSQGFPKGIDNRKISQMIRTARNKLLAGAFSGLYSFDYSKGKWVSVALPVKENNIVDIIQKQDTIFVLTKITAHSQVNSQNVKGWQLLDYQQDSVYGTSVNKAYNELLKGKKSHPVIVAVIDEGVDITHEDLQGHIWTNKKEIPGNGIDDDKNGYTDDVHGWNFLGGKDGKMIYVTSSEADREYARLLPEYITVKDSSSVFNKTQYQYFLRVKKKHIEDSVRRNRDRDNYTVLSNWMHQVASADSFMQKRTQKQLIYYSNVESFQPKDSLADRTKEFLLDFYKGGSPGDKFISLDSIVNSLVKGAKEVLPIFKDQQLLYKQQLKDDAFELRKEIAGDNPFDINNRNYGNNIVGDKYADHGTHCAGIISAIRNNGIGMDGIAGNVLIMPIRAINWDPYSDGWDKDIALAIGTR